MDNGTTTGKLPLSNIVPDGTTTTKGIVQLEDSHTSTSTTTAAMPKNVKEAYDLANGKYSKPGTGIPSTDMTTAVQASLGKADSSASASSIALAFDATATYKKNDIVMYGNSLYRFKADHTGAWSASDVDAITIVQLLKEQNMKKFTVWASTGVSYQLTGEARTASFSPSSAGILETYAISSMNNNVALLDGTKSSRIVGAMVKAGGGFGLQPASGEKAANLVVELIAVSDAGAAVGSAVATYNIQLSDWGTWETKDIELSLPTTVPSGATGFGFNVTTTTEFTCDDYNIQTEYVDQYVVPEVLLEIETDDMVVMSTGAVIN